MNCESVSKNGIQCDRDEGHLGPHSHGQSQADPDFPQYVWEAEQ